MINARDLRMVRQPCGDFEAAFLMLAQSDAERAQPAAGHISRVGVEHLPHQIGVFRNCSQQRAFATAVPTIASE